jgi:nuclease S1
MINSAKKHLICFILAVSLVSIFPARANAWGAAGHRIVAIIAEDNLNTHTRERIADLLGEEVTLASVANFADEIRFSRPDTKQFHFVDIPLTANSYDPARDCRASEEGDCVIAAIERFRQELANTSLSKARRRFALKFLVHLVGDMHQPLHCADNDNDRGGNDVKVVWFGRSGKGFNLHAVWDKLIIQQAELTDDEFAEALVDGLTSARIQTIQSSTVIQWAEEAHRVARERAYRFVPGTRIMNKSATETLGQAYYNRNFATVDDQLLKGGLRLAKILNDTLP